MLTFSLLVLLKKNICLLVKHYNNIRNICKDTIYEDLFVLSDDCLLKILLSIKRDIIYWIINQCQSYFNDDNQFNMRLLTDFKDDTCYFINKK